MNIEAAITSASILMLNKLPLLQYIYRQLPQIYTTDIPTLAVGKHPSQFLLHLYINPDYVEGIINKFGWQTARRHFSWVLTHEMLHVVYKHCFLPVPKSRARELACECVVNSYVNREELAPDNKGIFPEDYKLPKEQGFFEYYDYFLKNFPPSSSNSLLEASNGNGDEDGQIVVEIDGKKLMTLDSHGKWDGMQDDNMAEEMVKNIIYQAKNTCERNNSWGSMPASIRETVDALLHKEKPMVDWETALRDFVASSSETEISWTNKRISERFGTRPGIRLYEKLRIAVGIDTSGSIDHNTLKMFFSELYWIAKYNAQITIYECDCKIGRSYPFEEFDEEKLKSTTGGGGTDLEPVIKEASERGFDALIYFTDAMAPTIQKNYNIPTLLVVTEDGWHVDRKNLPYPAQMVFYVKDGKVTVE